MMKKSPRLELTQLVEAGVTPHMPLRESSILTPLPSCPFYPRARPLKHCIQIDVVNGLQLLTAKPVTYLVNLSEKDYIRKKNKW